MFKLEKGSDLNKIEQLAGYIALSGSSLDGVMSGGNLVSVEFKGEIKTIDAYGGGELSVSFPLSNNINIIGMSIEIGNFRETSGGQPGWEYIKVATMIVYFLDENDEWIEMDAYEHLRLEKVVGSEVSCNLVVIAPANARKVAVRALSTTDQGGYYAVRISTIADFSPPVFYGI